MENKEKETHVSKFAENPYVEIKKRVSMAGVWSVVVAVVAFGASAVLSDPQSSLKLFLIVVGVCFLIYGLIKLAVGNKVAVCRANGKVLKKHELLFESSEVSRLKQMVESGNFQSIGSLPRAVGHKAGAKLTLFIDDDQSFATAQVSEFIPFDYEPVMSPMSYDGDRVKEIAALTKAASLFYGHAKRGSRFSCYAIRGLYRRYEGSRIVMCLFNAFCRAVDKTPGRRYFFICLGCLPFAAFIVGDK